MAIGKLLPRAAPPLRYRRIDLTGVSLAEISATSAEPLLPTPLEKKF
jgi:hypothetical protein